MNPKQHGGATEGKSGGGGSGADRGGSHGDESIGEAQSHVRVRGDEI